MWLSAGLFGGGVLLGAPVAFALLLSGFGYMFWAGEYPSSVSSFLFTTLNSSSLLSIPFFILAAEILNQSGATRRLIDVIDAWIGHNRGGMPVVAVIAVAFFSAICGSSAATAAAIGSVMIPEMIARGYGKHFTIGLIASAGGLGILIPPSIPLIVYGMVTEISISRLFQAATLPGLLLAFILCVVAYIVGRRSGVQPSPRRALRARLAVTWHAIGVLLMPFIILGGIYSGIFTATESAAIACVYALGLAVFAYGVRLRDVPAMLTSAAATAAMILLIIAAANLFSYALTSERVPHAMFEWLMAFELERWQLLLGLMAFFILAGMFLEVISVVLISMPILLPVLTAAGIDPVHFAVLLIVNMELAVITPPIGLNLFVISAISGMPVTDVFKATLPFALVIAVFLLALMYMPGAHLLLGGW
ncbi:TRAP transporter large permease [Aquabacter spiritensis]|uniref:TRAP transporter large permease protein n=1 Tax=Aquabacter spiritensis TaxID=933073 RepID=A0A4R3LQ75_9HYPH|nr:TRAP transporter large permease [Aquabacter spiritensis]TCT01709.1 C4-dicarboxylate transporter DctM subunit [Aquabacter spiritensis]